MGEYSEAFVGLDVSKSRNAVAIADGRRGGEVRFLGEVDASPDSMRQLVTRLARKHSKLHFCYEAGPTGYGLHRLITGLGHSCTVVAPSMIPRKATDRVKTNRRDAIGLARLLRADELTSVWVPDACDEAIRDLVRARRASVEALRTQRQQVMSFFLRHGRSAPPGCRTWRSVYLRWAHAQRFDHPAQQIALQEGLEAVRVTQARIGRIEASIEECLPSWSLAPVVTALQALRGVDLISAVIFASEIGDVSRFESPRQLMAYVGLVPSECSTGDVVRRGGITKTGNGHVRQMLVESAWAYRFPAKIGPKKLRQVARVTPRVREIAWKAQLRLNSRYRAMMARGKKPTVVCAALARELVGFMWAIAREAQVTGP